MAPSSPAKYFREVKSELAKVTWPTKDQVIRLTGTVIVVSAIVGFFVGGLDFGFTKLVEIIVKK